MMLPVLSCRYCTLVDDTSTAVLLREDFFCLLQLPAIDYNVARMQELGRRSRVNHTKYHALLSSEQDSTGSEILLLIRGHNPQLKTRRSKESRHPMPKSHSSRGKSTGKEIFKESRIQDRRGHASALAKRP